MGEKELIACPFCNKPPVVRNGYGSVTPTVSHSCAFVDIHEGNLGRWNSDYCGIEIDLLKSNTKALCIDQQKQIDSRDALITQQRETIGKLGAILEKVFKESRQLSNYAAFWSYSDSLHFEIQEARALIKGEK